MCLPESPGGSLRVSYDAGANQAASNALRGGLGGPSLKYRYLPQTVAITASVRPPGATPAMMNNKVSMRQRMCR